MKILPLLFLAAFGLTACTGTADPEFRAVDFGPGIRPIAGSLAYGEQSRGRYSRFPPGYGFTHEFYGRFGSRVTERYHVREDGSIELTSRRIAPITISGSR